MTINDEELLDEERNIEKDYVEEDNEDVETLEDDEQEYTEQNGPSRVKRRSKAEVVINTALWLAIIVLLVMVLLRLFVFNSIMVSGPSMNPTYENGDSVVINKANTPKRGDVVVFYLNDVDNKFAAMFAPKEESDKGGPYEKLIKRVIATAGDKIWVRRTTVIGNDVLYEVIVDPVNGDRLYENYYVKKGELIAQDIFYIHSLADSGLGILEKCTESKPFIVSKDCMFVMGDNRSDSHDSRAFGEVPVSRMFGVVLDK